MITFLLGSLIVLAFAALIAFIGNNLGVYSALTGDSSSYIGIFVFSLVGAIIGQVAGWGFDFGPQAVGVYLVPAALGALLGMFIPAVIEAM